MLAKDITDQYAAGLISQSEARELLQRLARQAAFNRDYSDTLPSYERFERERRDAMVALNKLSRIARPHLIAARAL